MKKILLVLFLLVGIGSATAPAYEIYQGPPSGKFSDTVTIVNASGVPATTAAPLYTSPVVAGSAVSVTNSLPVQQVNPTNGKPALQQDMIGNATSPQTTRTYGFTVGSNNAVQNVRCDLWEGPTCIYVFPTVAQQMAFVSSDASDNGTGTGAQTVHIHYLDGTYTEKTLAVTLNGVTPVLTVATDIFRINAIHIISVGTNGSPVGNISLTNVAGTVTYGYVSAGHNTGRQAIYTIPAAKYGYISHWQASSGASTGTHFTKISIRATQHSGLLLPGVFILLDEVGTLNNGIEITLPIPILVPPMTDIKMSAISDASNANVNAMGAIMGWFESQ